MKTVEAVFASGVFKPLGQVSLQENQRVRLTVQFADDKDIGPWLDAVREFQLQVKAQHGELPDSTPEIAVDRLRHE